MRFRYFIRDREAAADAERVLKRARSQLQVASAMLACKNVCESLIRDDVSLYVSDTQLVDLESSAVNDTDELSWVVCDKDTNTEVSVFVV